MSVVTVALLAMSLQGAAPDDGPAEWVSRLGSPLFALREQASEKLKQLGPRALPALREARSSRDLEVRNRAAMLIEEIEAMAILGPTTIRLDFHDRPLGEVIDAINQRSGMMLVPVRPSMTNPISPARSAWPERRITLESPEPVPFWEAITRLCRAGGLRRDYPVQEFAFDHPFRVLTLVPGESTPPASDFGSFRVELLRIYREGDLDLTPGLNQGRFMSRSRTAFNGPLHVAGPGFGPNVKEVRGSSFLAELLVSVEPRLRIVSLSAPERLEVKDDQGRSVLREPTPEEAQAEAQMFAMNPHIDPQLHPELRFGSGSGQSSPTRRISVPLADSIPHGGRLTRLKGQVAAAVIAQQDDPLVLPLADARGKSVESRGAKLTIHSCEVKPRQWNGEIDLTYDNPQLGEKLRVRGPGVSPIDINRPGDFLERQIEILDDMDRAYHWQFLQTPSERTHGRMRLIVYSRNQPERLELEKLRIRVSMMVGAAIEVPFSFADVPLP